MFNRIACVTFILSICSIARAVDFTVNDTSDQVDATPGNGICATAGGTCTLRAAIMETNALGGADTITLPAGVFNLTHAGAGEDAAATGDLDVTGQLSITGAGPTQTIIDGLASDRVFHLPTGQPLTLTGLTIRNGSVPGLPGGGVFQAGPGGLNLSNVNFENNYSSTGGAVFIMNGSFVANGGEFRNNACAAVGGAVYISGTGNVDIANLVFQSNKANGGPGGGIAYTSTAGNCGIVNSQFIDNRSAGGAGAYISIAGSLNVAGCQFQDSFALGGPGGAIAFITTGGNATINNSSFTGGTSTAGGGVYISLTTGSFTASDCTFSNGFATGPGGGVFMTAGTGATSLTNITVDSNIGTGAGGGIYVSNNAPVNITNCPFTGNSATGPGGGLFLAGGAATSLKAANVAFNMNSAIGGTGGGLYASIGLAATLTNFNFAANIANGPGGGAFFTPGTGLTLSGGAVSGNEGTTGAGGGVYTSSPGPLSVSNVGVLDNYCGSGPGGGFFAAGHSSVSIQNSLFIGNGSTAGPGGGIYDGTAGATTIADSIVGDCTANASPGGGIYRSAAGAFTVSRCAIYNNRATGVGNPGGGIFNSSPGVAAFTNVTISGNQAGGNGGGYYSNSPLTLTNCTIAENSSAMMGGGIFSGGPAVTFINNIVARSLAGNNCAGGAFVSGNNNVVDDGSCGLAGVGDKIGVNPMIDVLADNGGNTMTHALLAGSPAIDPSPAPGCPSTDQRGIQRPQNAGAPGTAVCDIGAFEVVDCNGNGTDDSWDVRTGATPDCNTNGIPDSCDGPDANGNGILDACEAPATPPSAAAVPCGLCGPGVLPLTASMMLIATAICRKRRR